MLIFERWDTSVTLEDTKDHSRSLAGIKTCAKKKAPEESLGCIQQPLFEIELDHIVADELHLLLRITDRLVDALVHRMAQLDHTCRVRNTGQPNHMAKLVYTIKSCGVPFQVSL